MKKILIASSLLFALTPFTTSAATKMGAYMGASYGYAMLETSLGSGESAADHPVDDDSDTAYKIFAGYRFNQNLAIELTYADLGEATLEESWTGGTYRGVAEASTVSITALGILPMRDNFEIFGKVGMNRWSAEYDEVQTGGDAFSASTSDDSTDVTAGVGIGYSVDDRLTLRIEAETFKVDSEYINFFSAGAQYNF